MNYIEKLYNKCGCLKKEDAQLTDLRHPETLPEGIRSLKLSEYRKNPFPGTLVAIKEESDDTEICLAPKKHSLIIGSTGSGKTQYLKNCIELMMANRENMLFTDPKKELSSSMEAKLKKAGYKVVVLDLAGGDTDFFNTFGLLYKKRVEQLSIENCVKAVRLKGGFGYMFEKSVYSSQADLQAAINRKKTALNDEIESILLDISTTICPVRDSKNATWDFGGRRTLRGLLEAMLEDVEDRSDRCFPLVTESTFNIETLLRIFSAFGKGDDDDEYDAGYFSSRPKSSAARQNAGKTILIKAQVTRDGYMGVLSDDLSVFENPTFRLLNLSSSLDFSKDLEGEKPLAIFICPDETKRCMDDQVSFLISRIYAEVTDVIRSNGDRPLKRPFNFCLDEFGNIAKLQDFSRAVSVGRARNIHFLVVLQSYAQLDFIYSEKEAQIIKDNMCHRFFFGSPDLATKKRFSAEAGEKTVISTTTILSGNGPHITNIAEETVPVLPISMFSCLKNGDCLIISDGDAFLSNVQFHYTIKAFQSEDTSERAHTKRKNDIYLGDPAHTYSIL